MPSYPPTSEPTISASSPVTASIVPPIPVPTYGEGGSFSVLAKTRVPAPSLAVLNLIRDTTTWPQWNSFCPASTFSPKSKPELSDKAGDGIPRGHENWMERGSTLIIDVYMSGDGLVPGSSRSRTQEIRCTILEKIDEGKEKRKGYRIAWKSVGYGEWNLRSERVMEFVETEDEEGKIWTEYACWETFGGLLGSAVKLAVGGQLTDRFGDYARDIRTFFGGSDSKPGSVASGNSGKNGSRPGTNTSASKRKSG